MIACRKLEDGDIVNVDVSVCYKGVHGEVQILDSYIVKNVVLGLYVSSLLKAKLACIRSC